MTASIRQVRWKVWLRRLHIHVSLLASALLLFFAMTGFVLNHEDWFEGPSRRLDTVIGQVPTELLVGPNDLAIVELLRDSYGAAGRLTEFEVDDDELHVEFRKPGRATDAVIYLDDGYLQLDVEVDGLLETMTQLHMGKRSGVQGRLLVDLVAITLALTALGGLTLWTTLPARRVSGLVSLGSGLLLALAVWWKLVL